MRSHTNPAALVLCLFASTTLLLSACSDGASDTSAPDEIANAEPSVAGTAAVGAETPAAGAIDAALGVGGLAPLPTPGEKVPAPALGAAEPGTDSATDFPSPIDPETGLAVDRGESDTTTEAMEAETDKTVTYPEGQSGPGDGVESGETESTDGSGEPPIGGAEEQPDEQPEPPTDQPDEQGGAQQDYNYPPSQPMLGGSDPGGGGVPGYRSVQNTPISGMTLTRVSSNSAFGLSNGKARHQYSKRQAWNRDESLVMVGQKLLDAEDYSIVRSFVPLNSERNWSNLDADTLYGIKHPITFARYSVSDDRLTELRRFSEYSNCTIGDSEGNISDDDSKVVLACSGGGGKTLVSYDIANDRVLGTLRARGDFNWASITPSGDYIVVENNNPSTSTNEELVRYEPDFSDAYKLTDDRNHGDFGIDDNGDDVYVMISWDVMSYIRIRDGARVTVGASDRGNIIGHGHVSCRNTDRPGWCYFSAGKYRVGAVRLGIADANPIGTHYNGRPLYQGVAEYEPWGYHRSSWKNYDVQPKASASWSGTRVIITSDWYGRGEVNDYVLEFAQ